MASAKAKLTFSLALLYTSFSLVYVVISVQKYRQRKVAVESHKEHNGRDTIEYPEVTVCSGFRDKRRALHWYDNALQENMTADAMEALTYDRVEVITLFAQGVDNYWGRPEDRLVMNDALWTESVHPFFGGRCYTVQPEKETKPSQLDSLEIGLKFPPRLEGSAPEFECWFSEQGGSDDTCFFPVFVHERGALWYSKAIKFTGMTLIYPKSDKRLTIILSKHRVTKLNKEYEPCTEDYGLSDWMKCMRDYYNKVAGCSYPWEESDAVPVCDVDQTRRRMVGMEEQRWWHADEILAEKTGCAKPCTYVEYRIEQHPYEYVGIPRNWLYPNDTDAAVRFYYENTFVYVSEEYYVFDFLSLVGEVSGALGLFTGWSILGLNVTLFMWLSGLWPAVVVSKSAKRESSAHEDVK